MPDTLLAGAYPGHQDSAEHLARINALVNAGIRLFLNPMEEQETKYAGQTFVPFLDVTSARGPRV